MQAFDEKDFLEKYHGTEKFLSEGSQYYNLFLEFLNDEDLLEKIKFANDVLGIPPIKTFIAYKRDYLKEKVFDGKMSPAVKQGFGACFGYLYRFMYGGYKPKQCWVNDDKTEIKTASCFVKEN